MGVVLCCHASDDAEAAHLFGAAWHELAEVDSWYGSWDTSERAAECGVRFRIPAFELTDSSVEPDEEDLFVGVSECLGAVRGEEVAESAESECTA